METPGKMEIYAPNSRANFLIFEERIILAEILPQGDKLLQQRWKKPATRMPVGRMYYAHLYGQPLKCEEEKNVQQPFS
jgi:hypothetical protein